MTKHTGQLHKMQVKNDDPVSYSFILKDSGQILNGLPVINELLGSTITLTHTGKINCINCNRLIKKTYNQGYCFPCMQKLAACDLCILKPENCHYAAGTCREPQWGLEHCFQPHLVYLANSSALKVGLTREINMPSRWIDQGAIQALSIMRVKSRFQAGLIEVAIKKTTSDRTDWRKMLKGTTDRIDMARHRDEILSSTCQDIQDIASKFTFGDIEILTSEPEYNFNYPVLEYPSKIVSISLEKTPHITDKLLGIKGQYLIFANGVINLRKYTGFEISIEY